MSNYYEEYELWRFLRKRTQKELLEIIAFSELTNFSAWSVKDIIDNWSSRTKRQENEN